MDDLLSAALCEAGLEEFISKGEKNDENDGKHGESNDSADVTVKGHCYEKGLDNKYNEVEVGRIGVAGESVAAYSSSDTSIAGAANLGCVTLPSCSHSSSDRSNSVTPVCCASIVQTSSAPVLSHHKTLEFDQQQSIEVITNDVADLPSDLDAVSCKSDFPSNIGDYVTNSISTDRLHLQRPILPQNNSVGVRKSISLRRVYPQSEAQAGNILASDRQQHHIGRNEVLNSRRRVIVVRRPISDAASTLARSRYDLLQRREPYSGTFLVRRGNEVYRAVRGNRVQRNFLHSNSSATPTLLQRKVVSKNDVKWSIHNETRRPYLATSPCVSDGGSVAAASLSVSRLQPRVVRNGISPTPQIQRSIGAPCHSMPNLQDARNYFSNSIAVSQLNEARGIGSRISAGSDRAKTVFANKGLNNVLCGKAALPFGSTFKRVPMISTDTSVNEDKRNYVGLELKRNVFATEFAQTQSQFGIKRQSSESKILAQRLERKQAMELEQKKIIANEPKSVVDEIHLFKQDIEEEDENIGYAETYSDYCPAKLRSGLAHPDCVIETASLSSVLPPDIRYSLSIPEEIIDTGAVSAVQLEAVVYACQAHEMRLPSGERTGYLVGDGAGVGKGRIIACIIFENYLLGRKRSLWFSVSSDLRYDAERDLRDIGAKNIRVCSLNKFKYAKISGKENGEIKKGCIFATYSSLIGECRSAKSKYRTRLKQLVQWCGQDFDGVIVFDECHRAKNLVPSAGSKPTKTGRMVMELQKALPNSRIVYASATGASEPRNMAYMSRIGLWGSGQAFPEFSDFINAVEKRGVGAMEIVAMDMKQRGLYLARQLSFHGVSFCIEEVPLSQYFVDIYDESVKLWLECRRQFQAALGRHCAGRQQRKQVWGQFWAAHQRFFKYLCIGAKVEACVRIVRESIKANKCVVIGLQTTGESKTLEFLDDAGGELTEFVSTAKAVLYGLVEKHFPCDRSPTDIFADFDKLCAESKGLPKRKIPEGDLLNSVVPNKRSRHDSGNGLIDELESSASEGGNVSSNGDESDGDSSSSEEDSDHGLEQGGDDKSWLQKLLDEAKSSDESDIENGSTQNDVKRDQPASDDEFNPFACDFTREDPWASKQQVVSDSPEKPVKRKKSTKNKIRKVKCRKIVESEAMKSTADEFMSSSRIVDNQSDGVSETPFIKAELLTAVERLGSRLPPNTLDQLIDQLGGPENVAEMTGRKGRIVSRDDGDIEYELRHTGADVPLELMNMDEKDKFMKGEKLIAIISEAASSGISLQSDRRAINRRRRVHITLELPWSADKAIQQFGRTHRSNQISAPEYIFLISELAGEKRFASTVAKRLESLGALTHGDRRATESRDLSQFNLDTRYGRAALDVLLRTMTGLLNPPLIPPPKDYRPGDYFTDMRCYLEGVGLLSLENGIYSIERDSATIPKFLNRLLGLPVHAQNALFQYFSDIVAELVAQAKHDGTYDMGIMDLGMGGDEARKLETRVFSGRYGSGSFRIEIHKIGVERGVSWDDAFAIWKDHHSDEDGFYVAKVGAKRAAAIVYGIGKKRLDTGARLFCVTRPSTGRSARLETIDEIHKRFRKETPSEVEQVWKDQYEGSGVMCQHNYFHARCKNEALGVYCETGRRTRTYFVLSGSVLSVWPIIEDVLSGGLSVRAIKKTQKMQIIRIRTQDHKIVGLLVLPQYVRALIARFEKQCGSCVESKTTNTLN